MRVQRGEGCGREGGRVWESGGGGDGDCEAGGEGGRREGEESDGEEMHREVVGRGREMAVVVAVDRSRKSFLKERAGALQLNSRDSRLLRVRRSAHPPVGQVAVSSRSSADFDPATREM